MPQAAPTKIGTPPWPMGRHPRPPLLTPPRRCVDLRDRDVIKGLETDGETKAFTLEQLEQLQAQVAAHIKALRAPGGVPEMH